VSDLAIRYTGPGKADLDAACAYLAEKSGRAAIGFVLAVRRSLRLAARFHELYPERSAGVHRIVVRRYRYVIYYRVLPRLIQVFAVLSTSIDPEKHQDRITDSDE
jgi:plasmid stabilization system protein ParE